MRPFRRRRLPEGGHQAFRCVQHGHPYIRPAKKGVISHGWPYSRYGPFAPPSPVHTPFLPTHLQPVAVAAVACVVLGGRRAGPPASSPLQPGPARSSPHAPWGGWAGPGRSGSAGRESASNARRAGRLESRDTRPVVGVSRKHRANPRPAFVGPLAWPGRAVGARPGPQP